MAYTSTWDKYPTNNFPAPTTSLNMELLLALCSIQGKSKFEGDMQDYILKHLEESGLQGHLDAKGNIYCTKGESTVYPTMVAHMDTVHDYKNNFNVAVSTDGLIAYAYALGNANENMPMLAAPVTQAGIGGDDRCGIYVALHWLSLVEVGKVAFFVEEETGGGGSRASLMNFFEDSSLVLQCDRKGHDDWVQTVSGTKVSSKEFTDSINDLLIHHGYKVTQGGGFTDVGVLKQRGLGVCAANMSCGYYAPHSSTETIFLPALENTLNLCISVLARCGSEKQLHSHTTHTPSSSNNRAYTPPKPSLANFTASAFGWEMWDGKLEGSNSTYNYKKTVLNEQGLPVTLYKTWIQAKEYEVEQSKKKLALDIVPASQDAKAIGDKIREWVKKDGSWQYTKSEKTNEKYWQKVIADKGSKDRWIVCYAKTITDIPLAERAWQKEWGQWDEVYEGEDVTGFTAQEISRFVHTDIQRNDGNKFLIKEYLNDVDDDTTFDSTLEIVDATDTDKIKDVGYTTATTLIYCPTCSGELQSQGVGNEFYCPDCHDWKIPRKEDVATSSLKLYKDEHKIPTVKDSMNDIHWL